MKYRLKFKALDARIGMRNRIIEYFKTNKDYKGDGSEGYVDYVDHWGLEGRLYRVYFNLRDMLVSQFNYSSSPQYPIPFTGNDLRFFDELGFDLTPRHKDETKQEIDDWFDKKALDVGLITKERFVEAFKNLGYEEESIDEGYADMKGDYTTWAVSKFIGSQKIIVRYYEGESWEEARGTASILHKNISGTPQFVKGPDNVLRLLDNLGIELNEYHTLATGQRVDDWFKKANDIDIKQTIVDFYKKNYPKLEVDAAHDKTIYVIKADKFYQVETNIYLDSKTISRFRRRLRDGLVVAHETFTNEELRFFDNLDFDFDAEYKTYTHQRMDDWFREENQNKK